MAWSRWEHWEEGVHLHLTRHLGDGWGQIDWGREIAWSLGLNTVIAVTLASAAIGAPGGWGDRFVVDWVMSQCIGFSIWGSGVVGRKLWPEAQMGGKVGVAAAAILIGAFGGSWLGLMLTCNGDWQVLPGGHTVWTQSIVLGLMFGVMVTLFFASLARIAEEKAKAQAAQLVQIEHERSLVQAHLKLLQAQIEPHFLFNTLANIGGLIPSDPTTARRMLDDLNRYLRVSLDRTRSRTTTLGQELEMVRAYLDIMGIRMGGRLDYRITVPETLLDLPLPPLLLQPLVENAIRHGLEPKVEGGRVLVWGEVRPGRLLLGVWDDGVGLGAAPTSSAGHGVGLDNVRNRLFSMWGGQAQLNVASNPEGGVSATLEVPLDGNPTSDRDPG
ncbi:MAG: sensor histidine kinase [Alphaproteobacteria bacterium CG_4_10_14_0_2_um_filter_63_37]|nr:MAG: hypothetical protein AUJ55_03675 [Proteobacteria bacterium CG1_02_64_396]PJA26073.1 MAG: sensor histidine kinase [Alphaproteobacteria bacterium CG_4_10_14_0_2_um_filter_63_37]